MQMATSDATAKETSPNNKQETMAAPLANAAALTPSQTEAEILRQVEFYYGDNVAARLPQWLEARKKHALPPLSFAHGDLEPFVSSEIMQFHHGKHHQAYVNNLNAAEDKLADAVAQSDNAKIASLLSALRFNAGGHLNHTFFWNVLTPVSNGGGKLAAGPLADSINKEFGSLDNFIDKFTTTAVGVQGSGWAWLVFSKDSQRLEITTTANQDLAFGSSFVPLLTIDVWEHAYYLQYKNLRIDFVKAIWNIINWKSVEERFALAQKAFDGSKL